MKVLNLCLIVTLSIILSSCSFFEPKGTASITTTPSNASVEILSGEKLVHSIGIVSDENSKVTLPVGSYLVKATISENEEYDLFKEASFEILPNETSDVELVLVKRLTSIGETRKKERDEKAKQLRLEQKKETEKKLTSSRKVRAKKNIDNYAGCSFSYEPDVRLSFISISTLLMFSGASDADKFIFKHLCDRFPNKNFIMRDLLPNVEGENFKEPRDKWYQGLTQVNGCSFTYEFGIKNNSFQVIDQRKKCTANANIKKYVIYERKPDGSFYGWCGNGSAIAGIVDNDGFVTASGPKGGADVTQSLDQAVRQVCGE